MKKWFSISLLIIPLFLFPILSGCNLNPVASPVPTSGGREYYPNTQGYSWTYSTTSGTNEILTFTGSTVISGITMQILDISYGSYSEDSLIVVTDTAVKTYSSLTSPTTEGLTFLSFPLSIGSTWDYVPFPLACTMTVISIEDVIVPAGTFKNCFRIRQDMGTTVIDSWYAKDVGMVKSKLNSSSDVIELISKNF